MASSTTPANKPRRFLIPRSRRLTCDVLHFHRHVPLCPHVRLISLGALDELRKPATGRISWAALFLKAYALMARDLPVFRQSWMRGLIPTIYEHPSSVGMLAVQREYRGEPWLFWGRIVAPENLPLPEIQKLIDRYQIAPVDQVFKRFLWLSLFPTLIRRLFWWCNMQWFGPIRAKRIGTFFLSSLAGQGAEIPCPPSIQTGVLSYGPLDPQGQSRVTIAYDHRLMDGGMAAEALARLEAALRGPLTEELQQLAQTSVAAN